MVKRKTLAPKRLDPDAQLTWTMGEASRPSSEGLQPNGIGSSEAANGCVPDLIDDSELGAISEAEIKPPTATKKPRKSPKSKKYSQLDEELLLRIKKCDFYLTVSSGSAAAGQKPPLAGKLGSLSFAVDPKSSLLLPDLPEFWIYVDEDPGADLLYFEWPEDGGGTRVRCYDLVRSPEYELLEAVKVRQHFGLRSEGFDPDSGSLTVSVWLRDDAVLDWKRPRDASWPVLKPEIRVAVKHFFGVFAPDLADVKHAKKEDIDVLYAAVKHRHDGEDYGRTMTDVRHADLVPSLRPYQVDAIRWMLTKENYEKLTSENAVKELHGLYSEIRLEDGQILYFNRYGGALTRKKPPTVDALPGGILADEMGLGKTVEVLACILNHPRPPESTGAVAESDPAPDSDLAGNEYFAEAVAPKEFFECVCGGEPDQDDDVQCEKCGLRQHARCIKYEPDDSAWPYYCPHCWITMSCPSRATLIVTPPSIICQWTEEIARHVKQDALEVFVYEGVQDTGFVQPPALADNDIVLMSYATMRKELNYVDLPHSNSQAGRRFRHPKRFMAIPSPLVAIDWWRICLDEAQMVECTTAKTAEMALRLTAVNRWCITGTPIQKRIDDLFGLLLFLGTDPYCVKHWWNRVLLEPYVRGERDLMHAVVGSVLWRTAKKDVLDQINIPCQSEELHWLSFSPVEEHFYRQQHIDCSRDMVARLNRFSDRDVKLNSLDRHTLNQLLAPLLRLRQACVHPQVVRGQFVNMRKSTLTMEELLESLIKKAKVESEEAHRLLVASLNGLAAIHIIREEWTEAAEKYREVLQSARELKPQIKTDKLQQLHALQNLAEVLDAGHPGVPPTLRDADLRQEAKELQNVYLAKYLNAVCESRQTLTASVEAVEEAEAGFKCDVPWWSLVVGWTARTGRGGDVVDKLKTELVDATKHNVSIADRFQDTNGLQYVIHRQLDDLEESHRALSKAVLALHNEPSAEVIESAVQCHLRPTARFPKKCIYCKVDALFNRYESRLFSFNEEDNRMTAEPTASDETLLGQLRRGTWADSEVERVLKIVFAFGRQHAATALWIEDGQNQIKVFEALKKEFRGLRGVWMQLCDQASAIDELNMATIRLRLRYEHERGVKFDPPRPDVLEASEVDHQNLKLLSDRVLARHELRKKMGQLLYLQNLSASDYGKRGGSNPETCPICKHTLGEQWSVLQCGHCFCVGCIRILVVNYSFGGRQQSLKCAVCRERTLHAEISYVKTSSEDSEEADEIAVLGSHSTKVEAVVRKLIQIKSKEPTAKTLVFSTWPAVLDILAEALTENGLAFSMLTNGHKFQDNLNSFKRSEVITVLLLPVHTGANGLNLVEATHVILVEPILNPSSELQAIGRVHRIGQTKSTFVHRFLVRGTMEERMHSLLKLHASRASSHGTEENPLTVRNLLDLFVSPDEEESV